MAKRSGHPPDTSWEFGGARLGHRLPALWGNRASSLWVPYLMICALPYIWPGNCQPRRLDLANWPWSPHAALDVRLAAAYRAVAARQRIAWNSKYGGALCGVRERSPQIHIFLGYPDYDESPFSATHPRDINCPVSLMKGAQSLLTPTAPSDALVTPRF